MTQDILTPATMKRGGRYNWRGQPDRLIYLRRTMYGWHQFEKVGDPRPVWCEVRDEDLSCFEETVDEPAPVKARALEARFARSPPPRPGTAAALHMEIAAHNAAVDERKAQKRERQRLRRMGQ